MSALRSRSLLRSVPLRSPTPGLPALPLRKPPFFSEKFPRLGSKTAAPAPAAQGLFFTENKFPQKTATGSVSERVCGGGQFARKTQFFLRKPAVAKKMQCFALGKFAKASKFSAVQSRHPKSTLTTAFSKDKSFSQHSA